MVVHNGEENLRVKVLQVLQTEMLQCRSWKGGGLATAHMAGVDCELWAHLEGRVVLCELVFHKGFDPVLEVETTVKKA